jgi:hypothetical protein
MEDSEKFEILRERIFISHNSAQDRIITHEFTLLNPTDHPIPSIFLPLSEFMIGLKVYDESNVELPIYTNELTKRVMSMDKESKNIIDDLETQRRYVLWIKLPDDQKINENEPKIIKLKYRNATPPRELGQRDLYRSIKTLKFLFSVPTFRTLYHKSEGLTHDIFYIFSHPDEYELDYKIVENCKIVNGKKISLTRKDKVYIDSNTNIISIRIPPIVNETVFDFIYDVLPERSERIFYAVLVFSLAVLSIVFALVGTKLFDVAIIPLNHIYNNVNTLLGGIITVSLASISFMKKCSTNKTRMWLMMPIIISGIGFLIKDILSK